MCNWEIQRGYVTTSWKIQELVNQTTVRIFNQSYNSPHRSFEKIKIHILQTYCNRFNTIKNFAFYLFKLIADFLLIDDGFLVKEMKCLVLHINTSYFTQQLHCLIILRMIDNEVVNMQH